MLNFAPMGSKQHRVDRRGEGMRLVDYAGQAFVKLGSKSAAKKALKKQNILLNGRAAQGAEFLQAGDTIELIGQQQSSMKALHIEMPVIFEDEYLIVVNKPAGIATNGNRHKTAENAVLGKFKPSSASDALSRPVAAHRLDVPTRGLLIMAKTKTAQREIGHLFQKKLIQKHYYAIVHGAPPQSGYIETPIGDKSAHTDFETVRTVSSRLFDKLSLVRLSPKTGRTHQLRIHMQSIGHLIAGDKQYADGKRTILGKGVYLAACALSFRHPVTGKPLELSEDIPNKFVRLLDREESRF